MHGSDIMRMIPRRNQTKVGLKERRSKEARAMRSPRRNQTKVGLKAVIVHFSISSPFEKKSDQGGIERNYSRERFFIAFEKKSDQGGIESFFIGHFS